MNGRRGRVRHGDVAFGRWLIGSLGACALALALLWSFLPDPRERPFLELLGGGFVFVHDEHDGSLADVYAGFLAKPDRPIPVGSVLETTFENPAGGAPFVVTRRLGLPDRRISVQSPSLQGVRADTPYAVTLRLLARESGETLWSGEHVFRSSLDGVPYVPRARRPGYGWSAPTPNPPTMDAYAGI